MEFKERLTCPEKTNKYYTNAKYSPFVYCYNMFEIGGNCTSYAYSRMAELLDRQPKELPTTNAENWYADTKFKKGSIPKLGAIICWKKGKIHYGKDGAGHVAAVERINSDSSILISESGYKNFLFRTRTLKPPYSMSGYQLEGFIYCPNEYDVPEDKIAEDGIWGKDTTRKAQKVFGTTIDGIVSNQYYQYKAQNPGLSSATFEWKSNPKGGSLLIAKIQELVGAEIDEHIGPDTIKLMQKYFGTTVDGKVSKPSLMVKEFQKWLNKQ